MPGDEAARGVYGGVPAEQRQAERRQRLLDAALDLLGSHGWPATTVRGICQHAKLNPRYFYESFATLDALLLDLFEGLRVEAQETVLTAIAGSGDDPERITRAAISAFVHLSTDDPRKGRVAFIEAMGHPELSRRRLDTLHEFADLIATLGRQVFRATPDEEEAVQLTAQMLVGGLAEALIAWFEGRLDVSRESLIDHATALFLAAPEAARSAVPRSTPDSESP